MEELARVILELAVSRLEFATQGDSSEWVEVSATELTAEQSVRSLAMLAALDGLTGAITKIIYGSNILTPALTHKGWMFWKKLPVTENENSALSAAMIGYGACCQELAERARAMATHEEAFVAHIAGFYSCTRQFSDDLREVLNSSLT